MSSTRTISTANVNAMAAGTVRPILFCRLAFASGAVRVHTEIGPRVATHPIYGSETYNGVGDFGGISGNFVESISNAQEGIRLALSGVSSTFITAALNASEYHHRDVDMMFGFDDENGDLVDDPVVLTTYYMDKCTITLGKGKADIVLQCESRASILQQASDLRFTDEQLQSDYSGDLGGEYIYRMLDIQLPWGDGKVSTGTGSGGSRWGNYSVPKA